jgi:hypothetical protein
MSGQAFSRYPWIEDAYLKVRETKLPILRYKLSQRRNLVHGRGIPESSVLLRHSLRPSKLRTFRSVLTCAEETQRLGALTIMTDLQLRQANRYRLSAPVSFWWYPPEGSVKSSEGVTQDISHAGVLVMAHECPPAGVQIQLTVLLPGLRDKSKGMKLHGEGVVVRLENSKDGSDSSGSLGFAASVQFYPENPSREGNEAQSRE